MKYADGINGTAKNFLLFPENKKANLDNFTDNMISVGPKNYRPHSELICD